MKLISVVLANVLGAGILFWAGVVLGKRVGSRAGRWGLVVGSFVVALPGLVFALYYTHLIDNFAWFYSFRIVRFTEFLPAGIGLLAGVAHAWFEPESFGERLVVPVVGLVMVMVPFVKPLLDPIELDRLKDQCEGEVCMQSTFSTCGPSSAATLLKEFGRTASERELARECLTSRGGTEIWYIARALERRGFHPRVVIPRGNLSPLAPAIAGVVLPGPAGHFIAIMNVTADEVTIGDPMVGKIVIPRADLPRRYKLTGFFLTVEAK